MTLLERAAARRDQLVAERDAEIAAKREQKNLRNRDPEGVEGPADQSAPAAITAAVLVIAAVAAVLVIATTFGSSVWNDYVNLPETQFFIHYWPVLLMVLGVVTVVLLVTFRYWSPRS